MRIVLTVDTLEILRETAFPRRSQTSSLMLVSNLIQHYKAVELLRLLGESSVIFGRTFWKVNVEFNFNVSFSGREEMNLTHLTLSCREDLGPKRRGVYHKKPWVSQTLGPITGQPALGVRAPDHTKICREKVPPNNQCAAKSVS